MLRPTIRLKMGLLLCILSLNLSHAKSTTLLQDPLTQSLLGKPWYSINGSWQTGSQGLSGTKNADWGILLAQQTLPGNYTLTFSTLVDPNASLFEVMLNLKKNRFVGVLYNQLDKTLAIEDRSLFDDPEKHHGYIRTTGHIGQLPKVDLNPKPEWVHWRIQKTGKTLYIWLNDQPMLAYTDRAHILKTGGYFGFAINGQSSIKNLSLSRDQGDAALPPSPFQAPPRQRPFFLFSE